MSSVDYAPAELEAVVPFDLVLIRPLPGPDRDDYWLAELAQAIEVRIRDSLTPVSHFIVAARWQGTRIEPKAEHLPINLAAVLNANQLTEAAVDFEKSEFIAIGIADEVEGGNDANKVRACVGRWTGGERER